MIEARGKAKNLNEFKQGAKMSSFWGQVAEQLHKEFGVKLDVLITEYPAYINPEKPEEAGAMFGFLDCCWSLMGKNEPEEFTDLVNLVMKQREEVVNGRTEEFSDEEVQVVIDKAIAYEKNLGHPVDYFGLTAGMVAGTPGYKLGKRLEEGAWRKQ